MVGYGSQPSAPDVSNEVTIGNDGVTKTRLKGALNVTKKSEVTYASFTGSPDGGRPLKLESSNIVFNGDTFNGAKHTLLNSLIDL